MEFIRFSPDEMYCIKMGYEEVTNLDSCDLRIYRDFLESEFIDSGLWNVLLLSEPKCVMPWQYQKNVLDKFDLVVTFGPWRAKNLSVSNWVWQPYDWRTYEVKSVSTKRDSIVLVNSNKFGMGKSSMYGLRRETIRLLDTNNIKLSVYGHNWNMPLSLQIRKRFYAFRKSVRYLGNSNIRESLLGIATPPENYFGPCEDKLETISRYTFCLVIENDLDSLSEKLFDAIAAQAIPIYIGPPLEGLDFLERCLIRSKPNAKAILETYQTISRADIDRARQGILYFHRNLKHISEWKTSSVMTKLGKLIGQSLEQQQTKTLNLEE
jgi:hypothetical protein